MSHFLLFTSHFNRDKGIDIGRLSLNHINEGSQSIWLALSSVESKQDREGFHKRGGMIPPNYRTLNAKKYTVNLTPIPMPSNKGVRGNFYQILPFKITTDCGGKRSDFGIHLDANVPGSMGCIVLDQRRFTSFENTVCRLKNKQISELPLFIQYS